jgi:hypothetical protein
VNTNGCDEVKDLFDESKNYIRTVCSVPLARTHDAAEKKCVSYGMSLFILEPPEAQKALLSFANSQFKARSGALLHVHGKTSAGCSVLYNGKGIFEVYSDFCNSRYSFYCQFTREPKTKEQGEVKQTKFDHNLNSTCT